MCMPTWLNPQHHGNQGISGYQSRGVQVTLSTGGLEQYLIFISYTDPPAQLAKIDGSLPSTMRKLSPHGKKKSVWVN